VIETTWLFAKWGRPSIMDEDLKKAIKALGYVSTVGIAMALSIALGAFIGYYIDKKFGTDPWFLFIFLGFGIAAAFRNLYIFYKKAKNL
jgi:F0F1-type ATP synthase assembly protein I